MAIEQFLLFLLQKDLDCGANIKNGYHRSRSSRIKETASTFLTSSGMLRWLIFSSNFCLRSWLDCSCPRLFSSNTIICWAMVRFSAWIIHHLTTFLKGESGGSLAKEIFNS